jgi:hypothetical protein
MAGSLGGRTCAPKQRGPFAGVSTAAAAPPLGSIADGRTVVADTQGKKSRPGPSEMPDAGDSGLVAAGPERGLAANVVGGTVLLAGRHTDAMTGHVLYVVGGPPRVGKSALAQRLLTDDGIAWLPTDVIRTVLRRVLPDLDAADQDPVDAVRLAEVMYPHIEQAAEVCAEEAARFLIEGFELLPSHPARLQAALPGTTIRACFLGHQDFSPRDLASYRGPKPQHEDQLPAAELAEAAAWIRRHSRLLQRECRAAGQPYVDVGALGFDGAFRRARRHLLGPPR